MLDYVTNGDDADQRTVGYHRQVPEPVFGQRPIGFRC
jgi:hypothetical protein